MKDRKHDIERYLKGEMTAAEMHALEREALNDPFLAEALEGIEQAGGPDPFLHDLHELNRSLHERTHNRKSRTLKMWGWTAGMAATVLLAAFSGFLIIDLIQKEKARELAMQEEPWVFVLPSGGDSLTVVLPREASARPHAPERRAARAQKPASPPSTHSTPGGDLAGAVAGVDTQGDPPTSQREDDAASEREAESQPEQELPEISEMQSSPVADHTATESDEEEKRMTGAPAKKEGEASGGQKQRLSQATQRAHNSERMVRGKVTSATDGEGLPGVTVQVKGTALGAVTDADGNYQLNIPEDDAALVFSFVGFASHEVAYAGTPELNVSLQEDVASLSEVIVTGYAERAASRDEDPAVFRPAQPKGGKSEYKAYLTRAVRYPEEAAKNKTQGRVTVRFTVQPDGTLDQFEVVRGIGSGCDEELIRAIRQGPAWEPALRDNTPVSDKVKVRYRFGG